MPVRMTREGRAETREAKRTEQNNQQSKSGKAAGFSSTSQKGNIVHGKLKSQKELKKITGSEDYKKSDYEGKTKMLNVATANKGMSVKQKKLAAKAPPPNKLDEKDFAVLRAEKAKGRGMGLQDEKVQPGKVVKAKRGKMFDGYLSTFDASAEASTPKAQRGVTTIVGVRPGAKIGKGKKKFKSMEAMRTAKGFRTIDGKQETSSEFNKRRMKLAGAKKALSASRIGKIVLPIAAAGVAAQQYLKSKMNKKKDVKKKMGGGMMMQRPMGYKDGTKPGAGPLGAAGRAAGLGALGVAGRPKKQQTPRPSAGRPASQQQNKRKGPDLIVMMPVKEGPAKQNTTIKTFKIYPKNIDGQNIKIKKFAKGGMVTVSGRGQGKVMPGRNKKTYIC